MKNIKNSIISVVTLLSSILLSQHASAHVMVAQHGTLNILDNGVFMVISLPITAFEGVDDDNDGKLSNIEFNKYREVMTEVIHEKIVLKDKNGKLILEDMILSPVTSHQSPKAPVSQLVVMGRYNLTDLLSQLEYTINLFGSTPSEQLLNIVATRKSDHQKKIIKLTPKNSSVSIF
jgi:hypothetical protein